MESKYFKGAVFGGFDRHDVLAYIEEQAKERRAETDKLTAKLKDALTHNETLLKQGTELSEKIAGLETENAALRQAVEDLSQTGLRNESAINELASAVAQRDSELERLKILISAKEAESIRQSAQITEQTEHIEKIHQALAVFEASRQRVADIELAAFRRAEEIEKSAISNAERARDTLRKLLVDAKSKYDLVKADIDVTMLHIMKELDGVKEQLVALSPVMDIIGERIETLGYQDSKQTSNFVSRLEPLEDEEDLPPYEPESESDMAPLAGAVIPDKTPTTAETTKDDVADSAPTVCNHNTAESDVVKPVSSVESKQTREYIENPLMMHRMDMQQPEPAEHTNDETGGGSSQMESQASYDEPLEKPFFKIYRPGQ